MSRDLHHVIKQQFLRRRFPRGAVEVSRVRIEGGTHSSRVVERELSLVPVEKPPNPAHLGLRHVSLNKLLKDERNLKIVDRETHDRHHNANDSFKIEPDEDALEFARWVGLEWRLSPVSERAA